MAVPTQTMPDDLAEKPAPRLDEGTRLAYERTVLAHERTLMAWLRTAVSLITFGFAIYKFFALELGVKAPPKTPQVVGPREFALLMIAIGLFALVVATLQNVQYRKTMRTLHPEARYSLSSLVSAMISVLGLLALASVIFRW